MSWSVSLIGKPDAVVRALDMESARLTGQSKAEFDEAKPHLAGLLRMNYNEGEGRNPPTISLVASGHAYKGGDGGSYANCHVELKQLGGVFVE